MAEIVQFADANAIFERDLKVWRMQLAFVPMHQITNELGCTVAEAEASWTRMLGSVTPDMRARLVREELERLNQLQRAYWIEAMPGAGRKGNIKAAELNIKIMERRSKLLGLDAPTQIEPALAPVKVHTSSTERIQRHLDRIAGKKDTTIEGEVVQHGGETSQQKNGDDA